MEDRLEWVQIIEPKSKDTMYANLVTGECLWQAPAGARIKRTDENQWWELYDATTHRHYYYNAKNHRTVWQRPANADIIPLAKLQMIKENTEPRVEHTLIGPGTSTVNHMVEQSPAPAIHPSSLINKKRKQISLQGLNILPADTRLKIAAPTYHSTAQRPIRRNETNHCPQPIPHSYLTASMKFHSNKDDKPTYDNLAHTMQYSLKRRGTPPYDNYPLMPDRPSQQQPGPLDPLLQAAKRSQSIQLKPSFPFQVVNHEAHSQPPPPICRHISTPSLELSRSSCSRNHARKKPPRTNPNYVNIQIKSHGGSLRSRYIHIDDAQKSATLTFSSSSSSSSSNSSSERESIVSRSHAYLNESSVDFPSDETISAERTATKPKGEVARRPADESRKKQFVTCTDEFVFHSTTDPLSVSFPKQGSKGDKKANQTSHSDCRITSNVSAMTLQSMSRSHEPCGMRSSSPNLTRSISNHLNGLCTNKKTAPLSVRKQWVSSSLSTKSPLTISESEAENLFHDMLNLNIHKRGFFSKRATQDSLLSWSKETLNKPLLRTLDKISKKEAPEIFKLIQIYMGDRKSKQQASLNTCLELTTKGWSLPTIRDELYLQLIKQTTCNYNAESLQRGWELMAICLSFFPPSSKFQTLIERYISLQTTGSGDTQEVPISIYAKVCQKRLEKILLTGPKKGLRKPTYEEIELSKHTIHFPSMFGTTLEEVMALQRTRYPERRLPWIQTVLSDEVLRLNGARTEGIFRVPGDLDCVNALKVKCDQWQFPSLEDAHLPASLLKFWYRELAEPLIPSVFYERCISNCDKIEPCIRLVNALPEINRLVLTYLIRFLQIFAKAENVAATKMDVNNLSMVFAPNILRCDSEDARVIFENARKEILFIKALILHLNTDAMEHVL